MIIKNRLETTLSIPTTDGGTIEIVAQRGTREQEGGFALSVYEGEEDAPTVSARVSRDLLLNLAEKAIDALLS